MMKSKVTNKAKRFVFEYETNKVVQINSKKIGLMHKILQVLILSYVIGYVMVYMGGYQDNYGLSSSIVTKVKGISSTKHRRDVDQDIWDVTDSVVPAEERNSLFITTNAVITANQTQSHCPEDPEIREARCRTSSDCVGGTEFLLGHGVATGRCVQSRNPDLRTCEVKAWCPLEDDSIVHSREPLLRNVVNFTVFVRNTIIYNDIDVRRSNLFLWDYNLISHDCLYNANDTLLKYCPIFKVSTIIGAVSGADLTKLLKYGGVFQAIITWNCNLDYSVTRCMPVFTFNRIDLDSAKLSIGWNFRYANFYTRNNRKVRTLYKVYGLRILMEVRGKASKFSIITFTMNLGSGLALLAVATLVCDFIIIYLLPNRQNYIQSIYELHNDDDAYQELENDLDKVKDASR